MTGNIITTIFSAWLAIMLAGALGMFLYKVPALSLVTVSLILIGMILMFTLGLHAGGRRIRIRRRQM